MKRALQSATVTDNPSDVTSAAAATPKNIEMARLDPTPATSGDARKTSSVLRQRQVFSFSERVEEDSSSGSKSYAIKPAFFQLANQTPHLRWRSTSAESRVVHTIKCETFRERDQPRMCSFGSAKEIHF